MALYFNNKIHGEGKPVTDLIQAHPQGGLLACGWSSNKVTVATSDGEVIASVKRATLPTAMAWHPYKKLLFVGWRDGQISIWTEDEKELATFPAPPHDALAVLSACWTAGGNFLLTSSKSCAVVMWQLEGSKLNPIFASKSDAPVVSAVHLSPQNKALDTTQATETSVVTDDTDLLFALITTSNTLLLLDDTQTVVPLLKEDKDFSTIVAALWDSHRRHLVAVTNNFTIMVVTVDLECKSALNLKRKISASAIADMTLLRMAWAGPGLVAFSAGEDRVRFFNVEHETVYAVPFPEGDKRITSLASSLARRLVAAATADGCVAVFSFNGKVSSVDSDDWQPLTELKADAKVDAMRIFNDTGDIIVIHEQSVAVLQEAVRKRKWTGNASAVQAATDVIVVDTPNGCHVTIKSPSRIKEVDIAFPLVALWNGTHLDLYSITEATSTATLVSSVEYPRRGLALHADGILRSKDGKLCLENFQMQNIAQLAFTDSEGIPVLIDVTGDFLVCITNKNFMKIARVSSREIRVIGPSRPLFAGEKVTVTKAKCNFTGKRIAMTLLSGASQQADTRLWLYDVDTDKTYPFDFKDEVPESFAWNTPPPNSSGNVGELEHLLLACETRGFKSAHQQHLERKGSSKAGKTGDAAAEDSMLNKSKGEDEDEDGAPAVVHNMHTFFCSPNGLVLHHTVPLSRTQVCLVGCTVPNLYISSVKEGRSAANPNDFILETKKLRDFEGMFASAAAADGTIDLKVKEALMMFSYNTTIGNMDEAYRAVRTVKDTSVWHNLAKMCVTTKRLDVAEVCLANMQDGVAARALRESKDEPEVETRLGILAAALGMVDEAEKLFKKAKRQDLITELLIALGKWEQAQRHASSYDRIRMRPVAYRNAQYFESITNHDQATHYYEIAKCGSAEIPRMLFLQGRVAELQTLAASTTDKDLMIWWANFSERSGDVATALQFFEKANDLFNTVRLLCRVNPPQVEKAISLVSNPANRLNTGAAFFIGEHYESQGNYSNALQFYSIAQAYRRAIRVAKTNDLHGDIVAMVLKSADKQIALDCAAYFEGRSIFDKAVQLYQKGGDVQRAIDVCIKGGLYDMLHQISETLDSAADPETFIQMAEHFITSGHFDKAAQMLVFAKAFGEALQLCIDKNVKLTEEMAEAMTVPKTDNDDEEQYRISLLKKIAKVAKEQESWHLACKKYTQAGERVKAMKMLLRTGDTEKIIFFANHSRNTEIYVLAANYLQSQDWQHDANIYKSIVTFYTKAKAFENLSSFYDACSQLQIDEYRNYDNALVTLKEALKALEKGEASMSKRSLIGQRIGIVESFVNARKLIKPSQPCPEMVQICTDLLTRSRSDNPDHDLIEAALRVGDVYALLVEYYEKLSQMDNAFSLMVKMKDQGIELTFFLEQALIDRICKACGKNSAAFAPQQQKRQPAAAPRAHNDDEGEANFLEEEV